MATAEKTRQQPTFQQEPESSEDNYMTDDYEFSGDDEYDHKNESEPQPEPEPEPEPQQMRQRQTQPQPQQQQQQQKRTKQNNDYVDDNLNGEDDYFSDEPYSDKYDDDEYYDDEDEGNNMQSEKAMQPYQPDRQSSQNIISGGSLETVPQNEKSINDEQGMKLWLDLNLDIEVELKAQIHGDITLALL